MNLKSIFKHLTQPQTRPTSPPSPPIKNLKSKFKNPPRRSSVGKIARLPDNLRHQLNHRLLNGQTAPEILPWLNALPHVKKILAAHFNREPVKPQNLYNWRATGYQDWLKQRRELDRLQKTAHFASQLSHTARGNLARGAAALTSCRLLEHLQSHEPSSIKDFAQITAALNPLLKAEQSHVRLTFEKVRIRQRDEQLLLLRDKHQRDLAAISLDLLADQRAQAIEKAPCDNWIKIELIGRHMFKDLWEPRPLPGEPGFTGPPTDDQDEPDSNDSRIEPRRASSQALGEPCSLSQRVSETLPNQNPVPVHGVVRATNSPLPQDEGELSQAVSPSQPRQNKVKQAETSLIKDKTGASSLDAGESSSSSKPSAAAPKSDENESSLSPSTLHPQLPAPSPASSLAPRAPDPAPAPPLPESPPESELTMYESLWEQLSPATPEEAERNRRQSEALRKAAAEEESRSYLKYQAPCYEPSDPRHARIPYSWQGRLPLDSHKVHTG